jgi:peptidyl-prolyl cis-trans isomerase SurA
VRELPIRWLLSLCLFSLWAATATAQESRIEAVVNADVITADDVAARLRLVMGSSGMQPTPDNIKRLTPRVVRSLIDEKLQMQEAKRLNVKVTDEEVTQAIAGIEQRNNMQKGGLDAYLKQANIPRSTLIDQITASMEWEKLVRGRLLRDVSVSDEEVNEVLTRYKEDVGKPQSRVSEIFLSVDNASQEDEVKKLADRLVQQIVGGANFATVAQQFSQSPTAAVGGDLGWVTPADLGSPRGEAIEKMKPGEVSYPVQSRAGFYILEVNERRTLGQVNPDDTVLSLSEVVFPMSPTATAEERQAAEAQANEVSNTAKSCGEMNKLGHDKSPQLSTQIPSVKAADLPPDLRAKVMDLPVAQASKPLPLRGGIGVIMVCDKKAPGGGMPTREDIVETMSRQRLDALARRYLRDLHRTAFVDIRN